MPGKYAPCLKFTLVPACLPESNVFNFSWRGVTMLATLFWWEIKNMTSIFFQVESSIQIPSQSLVFVDVSQERSLLNLLHFRKWCGYSLRPDVWWDKEKWGQRPEAHQGLPPDFWSSSPGVWFSSGAIFFESNTNMSLCFLFSQLASWWPTRTRKRREISWNNKEGHWSYVLLKGHAQWHQNSRSYW